MTAYDVAYAFAALAVICLTLAAVGFVSSMPDPADAQPDYTPLDEWAATAALDPRDGADLPAGDGPCEASPLIDEIYAFLKEQAK